jgi:hypothetical protein
MATAGQVVPDFYLDRVWAWFVGLWKQEEPINENIYFAGPMGMEATFDRVLVLEDEFKSGYECESCNQTGSIPCPDCTDGNSKLNPEIRCKNCLGNMKITCGECNGKGELLVIPEVAKRRPTTGVIVSLGKEVNTYKVGEFAAYPNFCGEVWELSGIDHSGRESTIVLRMMKEKELLCRVTGHLSLKRMKNRAAQITG